MKRFFFAVGGTGGHIHPALVLAKQLKEEGHLFFIGKGLSTNAYFRQKYPYFDILTTINSN